MPIAVSCSCGKKYRVGDDAAGKMLRCKECQEMIPVPKPEASADDWDLPNEESEDDFGQPAAPPRRSGTPKSKSGSRPRAKPTSESPNPLKLVGGVLALGLGVSIAGFAIYGLVSGAGPKAARGAITGGVIAGVGWRWLRNKPVE